MSVLLDPDSGSGLPPSANAKVGKPASADPLPVEEDTTRKNEAERQVKPEDGGSRRTHGSVRAGREPGAGSRIMKAVHTLAKFAYDLLNDLF